MKNKWGTLLMVCSSIAEVSPENIISFFQNVTSSRIPGGEDANLDSLEARQQRRRRTPLGTRIKYNL